jgi:hypothetical protein
VPLLENPIIRHARRELTRAAPGERLTIAVQYWTRFDMLRKIVGSPPAQSFGGRRPSSLTIS